MRRRWSAATVLLVSIPQCFPLARQTILEVERRIEVASGLIRRSGTAHTYIAASGASIKLYDFLWSTVRLAVSPAYQTKATGKGGNRKKN